jgi:Protein of unknown function (DUF3293)
MAELQQVQGVPEGVTEEPIQVQGVPEGVTAEALPKQSVQGVPEGLTEEPLSPKKTPATPKTTTPTATKAPYAGVTVPKVTAAAPQDSLLKQLDDSAIDPKQQLVAKAVRGVRGLYHGLVGDEESSEAKGKTSEASPVAENVGFTPENVGYNIGKAGNQLYTFGKEAAKDIVGNEPIVIPDKGDTHSFDDPKAHTLMAKYVTAPSMAERQASQDEMQKYFETKGPAAAGHAISAFLHGTLGEYVPAIGPLAMALEDQAQKGDIGGALAQIASLYAAEKGTGAVKEGIVDRAKAKVQELTKSPEVKQAEANVEATKKPLEAAQSKYDAAAAEHAKYSASHAQGIDSPKSVRSALDKAKEELDEAQAHHELAKEHLQKTQTAAQTVPQRVGEAAGRAAAKVLPTPKATPEVPTEQVEAAPTPKMKQLGAPEPVKPPVPAINVKTPGQVQPETFPQEPKPLPRSPLGRIELANNQGTMGKPPLLTEGTPIGPKVPEGGLPKIKAPEAPKVEAPKPVTDEAALRALSAKKGELVETPEKKIHRLLQEALKPEEPKAKIAVPETKASEETTEKRKGTERRQEETPVAEERRVGSRRNAAGIRVDEEGNPEMSPDLQAHWQASAFGEKPAEDIGTKARQANPEPTRAETKGKPTLPKEEPTGYEAKKEEVLPQGADVKRPVKSAEEYTPAVQQKVSELSDDNLRKLAKAHGLNPDEYDFKARDERRHRVERDQLAKDITAQMGEDEKINLGSAAESTEKEGLFGGADTSAKGRASRAEKMFPRLRGPVDDYGNPKVSGGAPDTVGTKEAADKDTEHFANAKKELGPNASISEVAKRAQEMKDAAKPVDLKKTISDYNKKEGLPEVKDNKLDVDPRSKEIARAYDDMKHDPSNPEVKKSYDALIDDAKKQWNALEKAGIKLEPQDEDPYKSYDEMKKDFEDNKRLKVFRGGNELPEDHPLAQVDPKTGETYNVMFRAVHDAIGHLMHDNDFSEKGEQNAFDTHRQTMSKEAIPAMTTETKAQVASYFDKGDFPEQKAGILPDKYTEEAPDPKAVLDHLKSGKDYALLTAENPNNERATPEQNAQKNREMKAKLEKMGYKPTPIEGHVKDVEGQKENSFFVPDISPKDAAKVSREFGQASVMTKQGIHDLVKDTVHPSTGITEGPEAAAKDYHSTVAGKPFSVDVDFNKEEDPHLPSVSGGAPEKKLPTGDELIKKYGESSGDPKDLTFILKDGRGVKNTGSIHDEMLGGRATDKNPPRERFVADGNIRVRPHQGTAGREVSFSIPESGINDKQLKYIQKMSPMLKSGAVMIEVGKPGGAYRAIPYGEASPEAIEKAVNGITSGKPQSVGSARAGTALDKESPLTPKQLQERLPDLAQEHLTQAEKDSLTTTATGKPRNAGTAKFVQNLTNIPTVQEYTDIALQGEGARKWYSRSTAAFDAMHEEAPEYFKDGDKEKFLGVLAGDSPQQSVASNLKETLGFWKEWNDVGRPELSAEKWKEFGEEADKAWKEDGSPRVGGTKQGASQHWDYAPTGKKWTAENLLLKNLTLPNTKVPNIIKALNGEPMWPDLTKNQAFKAPSFAENLRKWIDGKSTGTKNVTNDSWMGLFGGIDKSALSKPENYHPLSVATRAAAQALGWEPEEAQAAIWSFTQALTEKGVEDPELIRHYSEDFKDLLANDVEVRDLLKGLGVNLDQLDSKLDAIGEKPQVSGRSTETTAHSVGQLKSRIEEARGKGAIPEPKSVQGNLFRENPAYEHKVNPGAGHTRIPEDEATRFNPEDFETTKPLSKLGKKKSPLGSI